MNLNQSAFAEGTPFSRKRQIAIRAFIKIPKILLSLLLLVVLSFQTQAQIQPKEPVSTASYAGLGHLITFDGLRRDYYQTGIMNLADNGKSGDDAFRIEILRLPFSRTGIQNDFALRIGQDVVKITQPETGAAGNLTFEVNGEVITALETVGTVYDLPNRPPMQGALANRSITRLNPVLVRLNLDISEYSYQGSFFTENVEIFLQFFSNQYGLYFNTSIKSNTLGVNYGTIGSHDLNRENDPLFTAQDVLVPEELSLFAEPDTTPPFVDFGSEFIIELDENGHAAVTIDAVGGDEFDDNGAPLIFAFSQTDFDCSNMAAPTAVTITVTNGAGISASTVMNAIVVDKLGPTLITNHVVVQLDAEGNGSYTVEDIFNTDTRDNCDGLISFQGAGTVNRDDVARSPFEEVVKGTDQNGNTTRTRATITVLDYVDTTPPILVGVPADVTVECNAVPTVAVVSATDNHSANPVVVFNEERIDGISNDNYTLTRIWTATDESGNTVSGTQVILVRDNVAPILVGVPADVTVEFNAVPTSATVSATDNCGANPVVTFNEERTDGISSNNYVLTRTWAVTDDSGNSVSGTQVITVEDATPPTVITRDITVYLDANGDATITPEQVDNGSLDESGEFTLSLDRTTFNCNDFSISCSGSSIEFNGAGIASGANGDNIQNLGLNQLTMEAWVKPNGGTVNSIIRKAGDYDLYIVNNTLYAEVWYEGRASSAQYLYTGPTVSNNVWSHVAFTFDKANNGSGKFYVNGVETVVSGAARSITPDITLGIGGSTEYGQSFTGLIDDVRIWSTERTNAEITEFKDFCIDANSVGLEAYFKIEANEGTTLTDYSGNGNHLTITGATWSFEGAPIESKGIEVILTVTDESNNSSSATANVIVLDNIAPNITLNGNPTVFHDAYTDYIDLGATATDNCSAAEVSVDSSVDTDTPGSYTVTLTATDASGNEASTTRTVIVRDIMSPTVNTQAAIASLGANGDASITANDVVLSSSDDSGVVNVSLTGTDFACDDLGDNTVLVNAEDGNGNSLAISQDGLVGYWKFGGANPLVDLTGNWGDIEFVGNASLNNGALDLNANGFARTSGYSGNTITSKTLISYITLEDLNVRSGAAISIDGITTDNFDAIVYAERQVRRWMNGSSFFRRTQDLNPGFAETQTDQLIQMAITYENIGSQVIVTLYRNGVSIGRYTSANASNWTPGNMEILFGARHSVGNTPFGSMDARISKALLYDRALSAPEIAAMNGVPVTVAVVDEIAPEISDPLDINVLATSAAGAVVNYVVPVGTDNCTVTTLLTAGLADGATFPIGTTVVTYTATDGSGNMASASFNVEVSGLAPEITIPSNITVSTDAGECGAIVNFAATETTGIPVSTITYNIQPETFFPVGTTQVTATATNPVGTSSESFTVTVLDNEAPTIPVSSGSSSVSLPWGNSNGWSPWVHNFNLPIPDGAIVTGVDMNFNAVDQGWGGTGAYASFEIQGQTIGNAQLFHSQQNYNINYSGSVNGYVNSGNNQLKMFFQGYSGWVAYFQGGSMTISYTVQGTRANDLTVYLDASGNASVLPSQIDPGVTDNCGIVSVTLDQSSFNCSNIGANEVNLIAVDSNGNESTFASTITVIDNIAPTIITQDISINLDASGTVSITTEDVLLSGSDNCGPVTYALSQGTFGANDVINSPVTIQLTGTDPSGNATSVGAQVTVIDPIPVVVTQDITVSLDENGNVIITPEQIDNGSSSIIGLAGLALDITSFDCSNVGTPVTVTLTATSTLGSSAAGTAVVTVEDNTAPEFLTRESFIIYLDANGAATVTPDQFNRETVSDNCGVQTITFDKTTFNCDERGFHVVNITATDASGNATVGQADVEVRDEIAPTVITQNIIVDLDENGNATISPSDVDGGTFDNCAFTLSLNIDSFTCDQVGENIVELTAHDQNGVFASANATVTVRDVTAPEFLTRESFIIYLDANGAATVTPDQFNRETISDNCGVEIITFDKTTFNCDERGFHVINITATDASGNTTVGQADVEVRDEIAPTVITQNIIIDLDENGDATISPSDVDGGTFDNCAFTLSLNIDSFTCDQVGENIVELTAHDQNGVFASANAIVTVRDVSAPTVITKDIEVALDADGTYTLTAADIDNGTYDNCTYDLSVTNNIFDCNSLGEQTVTLTATDANGNTSTATATVTVVDNAGPVIVTKDINAYLDENGNATITLEDVNEEVTDGCGVTSTTIDITSFDCSNLGANTVTVTAVDVHGNTSTATATVTVIDNIAPTVFTKNITVNLDAGGNATIRPVDVLLQEETTELCTVSNAGRYGMVLYQYVKRYRSRPASRATSFVFTATGRAFRKNPDGTATIYGTLTDRLDAQDSWLVRLKLKNASNWEEWSAQGNRYTGSRNLIGDRYLDWTYYELDTDSKLIGAGRNTGETISLGSRGGFQVGEAASGRNRNFGIGGHFRYTTRRGRRSSGVFNFDLNNCSSYTKEQDGPITDDNCGIASTSLDITSFDCDDIGDNIVNVTVKDESGNATTMPATVTVRDVTAPIARAQPTFYAYLGANGTVTIDPRQVDAGSSDNCGIVSYSLSKDTFSCRDSYYRWGQNVTYTVTDASGNSSSTVVNVRVADIQAPVISTDPITLVVYGRRGFQVSRRDIASRITDNCGVAGFYNQRRSFTRSNAGLNFLWVVATDNSGKRVFGYVRVNVVDLTQYGRSVPMCYNGESIRVRSSLVQRLLSRGATIGSCATDLAMTTGGTDLNDALEREVTAEPLIELGAFPNPSQGETTIKFSSDVAGPAMAVVMSPNGVRMNTLFDGEIAANENVEVRYNTSDLPSGVYIIRLVTAGEVRNLKLMVKK